MALIDVPQAGQTLAGSRPSIQTNFQVIDTAFAVDHIAYNVANQGFHRKVSFPQLGVIPPSVPNAVLLYSQLSALTGEQELFFVHKNGTSAPAGAQRVEFTSAGWANPGWCRLPSGILMKWRSGVSFGGLSSKTINSNTDVPGSPNFGQFFTILITPIDTNAAYNNVLGLSNITFPNFTVSTFGTPAPGGTVTFSYLAIGIGT